MTLDSRREVVDLFSVLQLAESARGLGALQDASRGRLLGNSRSVVECGGPPPLFERHWQDGREQVRIIQRPLQQF